MRINLDTDYTILNYRNLFHIAFLLISSPAKAWEEIRLQRYEISVVNDFLYPLIALSSCFVFAGNYLSTPFHGWIAFEESMQRCIGEGLALFLAYVLTTKVLLSLGVQYLNGPVSKGDVSIYVGYSMIVQLFLWMIIGILPEFYVVALFLQIYTLVVAGEGAKVFLLLGDCNRNKYAILTSVLLIVLPAVLNVLFVKLFL